MTDKQKLKELEKALKREKRYVVKKEKVCAMGNSDYILLYEIERDIEELKQKIESEKKIK